MTLFETLAVVFALHVVCWFLISIIKKRNDVADVAWGLGFVLFAWVSYVYSSQGMPQILVTFLVTVWGVRLASHISRRHKGKPEDHRYAGWRTEWKYFYTRSFFQIYLFQSLLMVLIAVPILFINSVSGVAFLPLVALGVLIWFIGFFFESVGDRQLKFFLQKPENSDKLMTEGLWKYTRHPNYFGEVTMWWGIWVMALAYPYGFVTIVGPLTITVLILFVSGVPLSERRYAGRPDFEEYKKKTSVFIPLPRKQ